MAEGKMTGVPGMECEGCHTTEGVHFRSGTDPTDYLARSWKLCDPCAVNHFGRNLVPRIRRDNE